MSQPKLLYGVVAPRKMALRDPLPCLRGEPHGKGKVFLGKECLRSRSAGWLRTIGQDYDALGAGAYYRIVARTQLPFTHTASNGFDARIRVHKRGPEPLYLGIGAFLIKIT